MLSTSIAFPSPYPFLLRSFVTWVLIHLLALFFTFMLQAPYFSFFPVLSFSLLLIFRCISCCTQWFLRSRRLFFLLIHCLVILHLPGLVLCSFLRFPSSIVPSLCYHSFALAWALSYSVFALFFRRPPSSPSPLLRVRAPFFVPFSARCSLIFALGSPLFPFWFLLLCSLSGPAYLWQVAQFLDCVNTA